MSHLLPQRGVDKMTAHRVAQFFQESVVCLGANPFDFFRCAPLEKRRCAARRRGSAEAR